MTTQTATLADFLLARIAEDEAASIAAPGASWEAECIGSEGYVVYGPVRVDGLGRTQSARCTYERWEDNKANAVHIARHDPARVLAECAAKCRIVEMHGGAPPFYVDPCDAHDPITCETVPCPTLIALAARYADHPDFREDWR